MRSDVGSWVLKCSSDLGLDHHDMGAWMTALLAFVDCFLGLSLRYPGRTQDWQGSLTAGVRYTRDTLMVVGILNVSNCNCQVGQRSQWLAARLTVDVNSHYGDDGYFDYATGRHQQSYSTTCLSCPRSRPIETPAKHRPTTQLPLTIPSLKDTTTARPTQHQANPMYRRSPHSSPSPSSSRRRPARPRCGPT